MSAAKYVIVGLSLLILAGCVFPVEEDGPYFYHGQGELIYQGRGWDGGADWGSGEQDHGNYQHWPD
jgi:hypothetical protein